MSIRIWFSTLAMGGHLLTSMVYACGLQDRGATYHDPETAWYSADGQTSVTHYKVLCLRVSDA